MSLANQLVFAGVPNSIGWWEMKTRPFGCPADARGHWKSLQKNGRYQVVNRPFAPTELRPALAASGRRNANVKRTPLRFLLQSSPPT